MLHASELEKEEEGEWRRKVPFCLVSLQFPSRVVRSLQSREVIAQLALADLLPQG